MGEVAAKDFHYMTIPHITAGLTRDQFTIELYKNGDLFKSAPIEVKEEADKRYVLSFKNDGTDYSNWTAVVFETAVPLLIYTETWEVKKKTVLQNVKQIRSRQDSEGGFFKGDNE